LNKMCSLKAECVVTFSDHASLSHSTSIAWSSAFSIIFDTLLKF